VGSFDAKSKAYDTVTQQQNESLAWLVSTLRSALGIGESDVYRHSEVSYKEASEATTAKWK
jgi:hypothetical protein